MENIIKSKKILLENPKYVIEDTLSCVSFNQSNISPPLFHSLR